MMDDDANYGEVDIMSLVERYEVMRENSHLCYFDVEDFDSIVSYYLYHNNIAKARVAIDDGMYYHPNSLELKFRLIELEIEDEHLQHALNLIEEVRGFTFSYKAEICILDARILIQQQRLEEAILMIDELLATHLNIKDVDLQPIIHDLLNASEYRQPVTWNLCVKITTAIATSYWIWRIATKGLKKPT